MKNFLKGFLFALAGLRFLLKNERNFKVHIIAFILVLSVGYLFQITSTEWLVILLNSALVFSLEAINTAIEKLCDLYSKEENASIKTIKDIAAGAVLISALSAVVIGIIIFFPYVKAYIQ